MDYRVQEAGAGALRVSLSGKINEECDTTLDRLREEVPRGSALVLNFAQVGAINSVGMRAWILFLRKLEGMKEIVFEDCPPHVIAQINMVPSFQGAARITTFQSAFYCETCDEVHKLAFDASKLARKQAPDVPKCPKCGGGEIEAEDPQCFDFLTR